MKILNSEIIERLKFKLKEANIALKDIKLFGSILFNPEINDIDIVIRNDRSLHKKLLNMSFNYRFHIFVLEDREFNHFEEFISYYNIAYIYNLEDDKITFSKNYTDSKTLVYNMRSKKIFNIPKTINKLKEKLLKIGYNE